MNRFHWLCRVLFMNYKHLLKWSRAHGSVNFNKFGRKSPVVFNLFHLFLFVLDDGFNLNISTEMDRTGKPSNLFGWNIENATWSRLDINHKFLFELWKDTNERQNNRWSDLFNHFLIIIFVKSRKNRLCVHCLFT